MGTRSQLRRRYNSPFLLEEDLPTLEEELHACPKTTWRFTPPTASAEAATRCCNRVRAALLRLKAAERSLVAVKVAVPPHYIAVLDLRGSLSQNTSPSSRPSTTTQT